MRMNKLRTMSVLLILLILSGAVSAAATADTPRNTAGDAVRHSAQSEAIVRARQALAAGYGLTSKTIGLFHMELEQDGDTWIIQFFPIGFFPGPLGEYQVTLAPGKTPETRWSYDDADPETWRSGGMDSPIWGQTQLLTVLTDREAAIDALKRMDPALLAGEPYRPEMPEGMDLLEEDESIWFGQILRDAEPSEQDLSQEEATAIAARAVIEESSLTAEEMDEAVILAAFRTREGDNALWMFSFQFHLWDGGIFEDWGIVVDARTGEILFTNIVTGGNG